MTTILISTPSSRKDRDAINSPLRMVNDTVLEGNSEIAPELQFFFGSQFLPPGYPPSEFGFTGVITLARFHNIGSVRLRSADPKDTPMFQMNYLQSEADVQKLVAGIRLMRQLFHTSFFDEFRGAKIAPGADVQGDEALVAYIRDTASTMWHPVGTCKMGTDPMAVVDPELRVHGVERLRIVDTSIMPTITAGNTNAPTIIVSEKAADLVAGLEIN